MVSLHGQHSVRLFSFGIDSSVWPGEEAQAAGLEPAGPSRVHYDKRRIRGRGIIQLCSSLWPNR